MHGVQQGSSRIVVGLVHVVLKKLCPSGQKPKAVAGKIFDHFDILPTPFFLNCLVNFLLHQAGVAYCDTDFNWAVKGCGS